MVIINFFKLKIPSVAFLPVFIKITEQRIIIYSNCDQCRIDSQNHKYQFIVYSLDFIMVSIRL